MMRTDEDELLRASLLVQQSEYLPFETRKGFPAEGLENFSDRNEDSDFYVTRNGEQPGTVDLFCIKRDSYGLFFCKNGKQDIGLILARRCV